MLVFNLIREMKSLCEYLWFSFLHLLNKYRKTTWPLNSNVRLLVLRQLNRSLNVEGSLISHLWDCIKCRCWQWSVAVEVASMRKCQGLCSVGHSQFHPAQTLCSSWEKRVRKKKKKSEKQPCRKEGQLRKKEGRCSRHWIRDSPAVHGEEHGGASCPPAIHGGPYWSRSLHCSLWRRLCWSRWMYPEGNFSLWRVLKGAGFLAGTPTFEGPTLGVVCSWMTPWYAGAVLEESQNHRIIAVGKDL